MELGEKWPVNFACDSNSHVNCRDFLHAVNLRHGANSFTSLLKEGMLRICVRVTYINMVKFGAIITVNKGFLNTNTAITW
jgi:hypothetical protein